VPDNCDEGWCWEGEEGVGCDGGGEGADVFLAVLQKSYQHDSHDSLVFFVRNIGAKGKPERERTYTAEKMPYEYYQNSSCDPRSSV
jgi:hypothetical protein